MVSTGIRQLRNGLSRFVRQAEAGERIAVTAHGRVIAELVPPGRGSRAHAGKRYDALVAAGIIEPAAEPGLAMMEWPNIEVPSGTVAQLIDADRGER
jgi:antitoxin (DNA-binding transcriptional repressor) of toxin-antitoxin stability system